MWVFQTKTISATQKENMKTKKDKDYYLRRAISGFKVLIIYQCVTKPQFDPAYKVNGKFSKDKLFEESEFFNKWETMGQQARRRYAKMYADYSKHHNLAFGLDCRLVESILGTYRDEDGRKIRISIDEVLQNLKGWVKCTGNGTKTKKNKEGKAEVVCWWRKKYFISSKEQWLKMLNDPKYSDYTKYPLDDEGFVLRAIKIISKFRKQTIHKRYSTIKELFTDFMLGNIEDETFKTLARKQFHQNEASIECVIINREKYNEDKTRTDEQDRQGQEISDETPSQIEVGDDSTSSGQGEEQIHIGSSLQAEEGLQKKAY